MFSVTITLLVLFKKPKTLTQIWCPLGVSSYAFAVPVVSSEAEVLTVFHFYINI